MRITNRQRATYGYTHVLRSIDVAREEPGASNAKGIKVNGARLCGAWITSEQLTVRVHERVQLGKPGVK